MNDFDTLAVLIRTVYAAGTLYMMALLLRWLGPWLEFDLDTRRLRWIPRMTDPLITAIRGVLPRLGPVDFAPLVAVIAVWIARTLIIGILMAMRASEA